LLALVRGQWQIEHQAHGIRDVTCDEDRSQVRCGSIPQVMTALRNPALGLLRCAGYPNMAAACRRLAAQPLQWSRFWLVGRTLACWASSSRFPVRPFCKLCCIVGTRRGGPPGHLLRLCLRPLFPRERVRVKGGEREPVTLAGMCQDTADQGCIGEICGGGGFGKARVALWIGQNPW
jgi:hypothetical protein